MHATTRFAVMLLCIGAVACSDDTPVTMSNTDDTAHGGTTWFADVQPMLADHCTRCHQEGGVGQGDFTDLDTVQIWASAMRAAMADGRMPPPAADPTCRDYVGSDHLTLPSEAYELFVAWDDAGQPLGEESTPSPTRSIGDELAEPDVVLSMPAPYRPAFASADDPGNEYRCFLLDTDALHGKSITAMAPVVGNKALVHHAVLYSVREDAIDDTYRDDSGWDCIDGEGPDEEFMLAAWAPGMLPIELPDGYGMPIGDDIRLVLQMHYYDSASADDVDDTAYAFMTTEDPVSPVIMHPIGPEDFSIPAGGEHTHQETYDNDFLSAQVFGTFPHMHELGTSYEAVIRHADGSETCVARGSYDFHNQMTYQFVEPIQISPGDRVDVSCTWDNTRGDADVGFGERTDEEMCYFFTLGGL